MEPWLIAVISSLLSASFSSLATAVIFLLKWSSKLTEISGKIDGMTQTCRVRHEGLDQLSVTETKRLDGIESRLENLEQIRGSK